MNPVHYALKQSVYRYVRNPDRYAMLAHRYLLVEFLKSVDHPGMTVEQLRKELEGYK